MSQASHNNQIDYIEFPATDIPKTKAFYAAVFGWKFEDYGPEYTSFVDGRLAGGFTKDAPLPIKGILVVLYATRSGRHASEGQGRRRAHYERRSSRFQVDAAFTSWIPTETNWRFGPSRSSRHPACMQELSDCYMLRGKLV
jgi:catechol 2,3-dioxygenase-like lactoylglutathione lyase family enzyme